MSNISTLGYSNKHGFYRSIYFNGIFLCRQKLTKNGIPKGIFDEHRFL